MWEVLKCFGKSPVVSEALYSVVMKSTARFRRCFTISEFIFENPGAFRRNFWRVNLTSSVVIGVLRGDVSLRLLIWIYLEGSRLWQFSLYQLSIILL